jgi:hypothetical protein
MKHFILPIIQAIMLVLTPLITYPLYSIYNEHWKLDGPYLLWFGSSVFLVLILQGTLLVFSILSAIEKQK